MTALPLRRIAFDFDARTPFQWNRRNPHFGLLGNAVSFFAQPFERYMVAAMRAARPRIEDPAIREEAEGFLRQAAPHARLHRLHRPHVDAEGRRVAEAFVSIPARARLRMNLRLLLLQCLYPDPERERVPPIATRWLKAHDEGRDAASGYAPTTP